MRVNIRPQQGGGGVRVVFQGIEGEAGARYSALAFIPAAAAPLASSDDKLEPPIIDSDLRAQVPPPVYSYCHQPPGVPRRNGANQYNLSLLKWATADASTEYQSNEHMKAHLNDGYLTNCASWIPLDSDATPWAKIDLHRNYWIKNIVLINSHDDGRAARYILFEAGQDERTLEPIYSWNGALGSTTPVDIPIQASHPVRIVKLTVKKWDNQGRWGPRIDEFAVYGDTRR